MTVSRKPFDNKKKRVIAPYIKREHRTAPGFEELTAYIRHEHRRLHDFDQLTAEVYHEHCTALEQLRKLTLKECDATARLRINCEQLLNEYDCKLIGYHNMVVKLNVYKERNCDPTLYAKTSLAYLAAKSETSEARCIFFEALSEYADCDDATVEYVTAMTVFETARREYLAMMTNRKLKSVA